MGAHKHLTWWRMNVRTQKSEGFYLSPTHAPAGAKPTVFLRVDFVAPGPLLDLSSGEASLTAQLRRECPGWRKHWGKGLFKTSAEEQWGEPNLRNIKLSGSKAERILEDVGISVNKNTVPGDKSAMNPSGIRFGTPPLTTRKVQPEHIPKIVDFIHKAWTLALEVQSISGPKLAAWKNELQSNLSVAAKVSALKAEVETFALQFPLPGHDDI